MQDGRQDRNDRDEGDDGEAVTATSRHEEVPAARRPELHLLPRSLLGLATLVFFMGVAAAFTGAVLYAYYESRLEEQEQDLEAFIGAFTERVEGARATIQLEGQSAV